MPARSLLSRTRHASVQESWWLQMPDRFQVSGPSGLRGPLARLERPNSRSPPCSYCRPTALVTAQAVTTGAAMRCGGRRIDRIGGQIREPGSTSPVARG